MKLLHVVIAAAVPTAAYSQPAPDILTIRLGAPVAEVRTVLQRLGQDEAKKPQLRMGQVNWTASPGVPASIAALHVTAGPTGGFQYFSVDYDEYVQVGFGQVTQKAFYVARRWGNRHRNPMLLVDLEKGLLQKYGKPHRQFPGQMHWEFLSDGKPATPQDMCGRSEVAGQGFFEMTQGPSQRCGLVMHVLYAAAQAKPDAVYTFYIGMYDHRLHVEDIRAAEEQERKHKQGQSEKTKQELGGKAPRL